MIGAHLPNGRTVNVNHDDCPAGIDTRKRLYVSRTRDNTLLGYCHNCGSRGFLRRNDVTNIHIVETTPEEEPPSTFDFSILPQSLLYPVTPYSDFTLLQAIKMYVSQYDLSSEMMSKDMWMYGLVEGYNCLVYPYCKVDNDIKTATGCQVRFIATNIASLQSRKQPKIKTYGVIGPHIFNPNDSPTIVVCEDRVSGVKVAQAGYAACVMNGSAALQGPEAHSLSMMFDRIVVWYDNDNSTVCENAESTERVCNLFGKEVVRIPGPHIDPKHYATDIIQRIIREHSTI